MKKTLAIILILCMSVGILTGCGVTKLEGESSSPEVSAAPAPTESVQSPAVVPEGEYDTSALEPITFKFGFGMSSKLTDAAHEMLADRIEELSNGKITVERYLQGQLYSADADGSAMVADGTIEMIVMGDMMALNAAPEICGWTQMPFIFENSEQCAEFWAAVSEDVNAKMEEVYNVKVLWDALEMRGPRVIMANKPMLGPDDFVGTKFRLPSTAATVAAFEALGVSALTSSWSEVYQVMQTGIAEAVESPLSNFEAISIWEVCDYAMETNHTYACRAVHVNLDWWNSLDPVYQEIINQAAVEAFSWYNEQEANSTEEIIQKMKDEGMTVYRYDEIDTAGLYEKASAAILEKYSGEWDIAYYELIQSLK